MKRKLITLVLTLAIIMTFTGCGKKAEVDQTKPDTSEIEDDENENEDDKKDEEENVADESEDIASTDDSLIVEVNPGESDVYIGTVSAYYSDYDRNNYSCCKSSLPYIYLSDSFASKYPALNAALLTINSNNSNDVKTDIEHLKELYEFEVEYNEFYTPFCNQIEPTFLRADDKVFSWQEYLYTYEGGMHGYYAYGGTAFDAQTGKELTLSDVITDEDKFKRIVADKLLKDYSELFFSDPISKLEYYSLEMNSMDPDSIDIEEHFCWSIDYTGVTIYFNPYVLGSFADGAQTVRVAFNEAPEIFNEKYVSDVSTYATGVSVNADRFIDIDGDGKDEMVSITETIDEYDETYVVLHAGNKSYECATYDYSRNISLIKTDSAAYAYIFHTVENDYSILEIIDLKTMKSVGDDWEFSNVGLPLKYDADYENDIYISMTSPIVNPQCFIMHSRMQALSTYDAYMTYSIGDDGRYVPNSDLYDTNCIFIITAKQDIPCEIVDLDGNVTQSDATIKAGSTVRMVRTNAKNTVDVQVDAYEFVDERENEWDFITTEEQIDLNKAPIYRIHFDDEYFYKINGFEIYDLFDGMAFAG